MRKCRSGFEAASSHMQGKGWPVNNPPVVVAYVLAAAVSLSYSPCVSQIFEQLVALHADSTL